MYECTTVVLQVHSTVVPVYHPGSTVVQFFEEGLNSDKQPIKTIQTLFLHE